MQPQPIILSVSDLTFALKSHIEPIFKQVHVRGEISNLKLQSSGHTYFSLIDPGGLLNAVLFKHNGQKLPVPLKNGDTIIATGEISLYAPRGSYQLIVREVFHVGLGDALLKLQLLKKNLQARGFFETARKRKLPSSIKTIGLVTSPTGAVLRDIHTILSRRMGNFHLLINPVKVQGEGASFEIAKALAQFSLHKLADLVIVCRGGGSLEDLSAFNTEEVAIACFESTIPIISAIGHETDLSITDLVADIRAETPSAAAEMVSFEKAKLLQKVFEYKKACFSSINKALLHIKKQQEIYRKRLEHVHPQKQIEQSAMRIDDVQENILNSITRLLQNKKILHKRMSLSVRQASIGEKLKRYDFCILQNKKKLLDLLEKKVFLYKQKLLSLTSLLDASIHKKIMQNKMALRPNERKKALILTCKKKLEQSTKKLSFVFQNIEALNPTRILKRGYAILFTEDGKRVIRSIQDVTPEDRIQCMLHDGKAFAEITNLIEKESL